MTAHPSKVSAEAPRRAAQLWLLLPAFLGLAAILRHEWWRDEAFTWLVTRASPSLPDLVVNIKSIGHPWLYYVMSWGIFKVWPDPLALSVVNLAMALAAMALVFRSAPFTRLQAVLFTMGFFPLYQYGVIARSYSLLVLLIFAFCHLRRVRPDSIVPRLLVLAILAQVHLWGIVIAAALLLFEWAAGILAQRIMQSLAFYDAW